MLPGLHGTAELGGAATSHIVRIETVDVEPTVRECGSSEQACRSAPHHSDVHLFRFQWQ